MKKYELYSYVYDFVSRLIEKLDEGSIRGIIVFGSVVRGDADKESDVDIFVDTKKGPEVAKIVRSVLNDFYSHSRHTWILRGIENQIKPIVDDIESQKWSNLKREIISNGLVIYGKYREIPKNINHYALIIYDLSGLSLKNKSKFIRDLLGYRLVKGKKEYRMEGLLQRVSGQKISKNVILIPKENQKIIYDFLLKSRSKFQIREIWSR